MKEQNWSRLYWATVIGNRMPCLWGQKRDAVENADTDERVIQVRVTVVKIAKDPS